MGMTSEDDGWSLVESLSKSSAISHRVAGFHLKRINYIGFDTFVQDAGKVTIGSPTGDSSLIGPNISWVDGQEFENMTLLPLMAISIVSKRVHCPDDICQAMLSVSSDFMLFPESEAMRINNLLGMIPLIGGTYATFCDRIDVLPAIDVFVGGMKVSIPPVDYLFNQKESEKIYLNNGYNSDVEGTCLSKVLSFGETSIIVLGQPFLQNVYTLFDYDHNKYGFAKYF